MEFSSIALIVSISITLPFLFKSYLYWIQSTSNNNPKKLPPGPPAFPIIGNFQLLRKSLSELEPILRKMRSIYGPIFSLQLGQRKAIFITTPHHSQQALVQHGSIFSDRPPAPPIAKIISSNQHIIGSAPYGPLWRLLRRNLSTELLQPSNIKSFNHARQWVLHILIHNLKTESGSGDQPVYIKEHFTYAMFCLLVLMCFGEKYDEKVIKKIQTMQRTLLLKFDRFTILNFCPKYSKFIFYRRWNEFVELLQNREEVLLPLIKSRQEKKLNNEVAYVDSLFNLTLNEQGGRKLTDDEIVSLCSEFLTAGTDTTSTALQWIMAQLVRNQDIQSKLFDQIKQVVPPSGEITEDDLVKLPYLKAVVLEGLRRHPPAHFLIPHAVTEDVKLDGYIVPKNTTVNFNVAEIGWDPKVWEDPMEYRPARFLGEYMTGSQEIKMMPFGAGRRLCPGEGLALLHLEYFVANLVMQFEWKAEIGGEVDLTEQQDFTFTTVMKNPLKACIIPRVK